MGLNIESAHVRGLARKAAWVTGRSQTGAIEEALVRLLRAYDAEAARERTPAKIELVRGVVAAYVADPGKGGREIARVEDLYCGTPPISAD